MKFPVRPHKWSQLQDTLLQDTLLQSHAGTQQNQTAASFPGATAAAAKPPHSQALYVATTTATTHSIPCPSSQQRQHSVPLSASVQGGRLPEAVVQVVQQLHPDALVHVPHLLCAEDGQAHCHGMTFLLCIDGNRRALVNLAGMRAGRQTDRNAGRQAAAMSGRADKTGWEVTCTPLAPSADTSSSQLLRRCPPPPPGHPPPPHLPTPTYPHPACPPPPPSHSTRCVWWHPGWSVLLPDHQPSSAPPPRVCSSNATPTHLVVYGGPWAGQSWAHDVGA